MSMFESRIALHWRILAGLALGVVAGLLINTLWTSTTWDTLGVHDPKVFLGGGSAADQSTSAGGINEYADFTARAARFVRNANEFVGDLFLRGLKFIAVPIVLFSLAAGVASLNDTAKLGRIGGKTIGTYLVTTAIAISIGLLAANIVRPGKFVPEDTRDALEAQYESSAKEKVDSANKEREKSTWQIALDIFPENPFQSMAAGKTLQVVVIGLLVGAALTLMPTKESDPLVQWFQGMTDVVIKIVEIILVFAPIAVFSLIVGVVADLGIDVLKSLLVYCATVIGGLAIMMFVFYPLVVRVLTPISYRRFFRAISPAQLLAFSSSSSGATMPVTMECVEKRLGVSEDVTSFVIPVGATINMDGTALYQGVAAVFIAQMFNVPLSIMDQLTIVLTATLASIGTAAVPGVGIVMLVIVLESVKIPIEGIAVILGVDRILDMCRTSCNVTGDCMVASIVGSSENELMTEAEVAAARAKPLDEHPPL
ncbi:MAG: dicarboxylate/amino acid:cation symporter [Phycisphaerales bacterium]